MLDSIPPTSNNQDGSCDQSIDIKSSMLFGFMEAEGSGLHVRASDFVKYQVVSRDVLGLGEKVEFRGEELRVVRVEMVLQNSVLCYTYIIGHERGCLVPVCHNDRLQGVSMLGEVLETRDQEVRVHFRCDESQDPDEAQWIPYTPESNHLMYSMPEPGTLMSICMGNRDEGNCFGTNVLRLTGANHGSTSNPERHYLIANEHMFGLTPEDVTFTTNFDNGFVMRDDATSFFSEGYVNVNTLGTLRICAQNVYASCVEDFVAVNSTYNSQVFGYVGTGDMNVASPSGDIVQVGFERTAVESFNAPITGIETHVPPPPPQPVTFWGMVGRIALGVVAVVAVTALVVVTGGTILMAGAAIVVGLAAVGVVAYADIRSGYMSGFGTYFGAGFFGAFTGAYVIAPMIHMGLQVIGTSLIIYTPIGGSLSALGFNMLRLNDALSQPALLFIQNQWHNFWHRPTPIQNGPYIRDGRPHGRPQPSGQARAQFERDVFNNQVDPDGVLRDPNSGGVINWQPGQPRSGVVDFGHRPGNSYHNMFLRYRNGEITLEQLRQFQFNPNNFQLEIPSLNRSRMFQ